MRCGLIAKKIGMTRSFSKEGIDTPVTVLKLENVQVTAVVNINKNGFSSLQVGAGTVKTKNLSKPLRGHFAKAKVEPKQILKEFTVSDEMLLKVGDTFSTSHYEVGQKVDVTGTSIGKGFSGAMKRHNFSGLEATHGVSISHRSHGSTGNSQDPGRVWKGKKMAGQYGNVQKTIQSLTVVDLNNDEGLIFIKGSVPGPNNSFVIIKDALKHKLPDSVLKPAGLKNSEDANSTEIKKTAKIDDNKDEAANEETETEVSVSEAKVEVSADVRKVETSFNNEDSKMSAKVADKNDINKDTTKE